MFTHEQFKELEFAEKKEVMAWRAKFHTKKAKATAEMKRIPKNGWNDNHKYHFARESDVKDMIREILNENNLSITNDLIGHVESNNGKGTKTDIKMLFTVTDTETGYFENFTHDGVAIDYSDKGIYKAYSNTIKYFLMDQFLIPTGDDVEKESPEIEMDKPNNQQGNRNQNNNNQNQQRNQQSNQSQQPQNRPSEKQPKPSSDKPLWKQVMSLEDALVGVSGKDKAEVRGLMRKQFGDIGMYKELTDSRALIIVNQLNAWIDYYSNPQG